MNFKDELIKLNININNEQLDKFELYYNKLIEVNSYMNLTAIVEHDEVYNKHFLDSLSIVKALDLSKEITLCDVGSGAGFPSIPLAIVSNNAKVTIIDALNKRINFLNDLIKYIKLDNVSAYHKRAEDYAKEKREGFDIVTARAVARLNILAELCLPLVKLNGYFLAMKGTVASEEINEASNAIGILGGKIVERIKFELPDSAGEREIIVIKKVKATPTKYPRAFAKIKEKPL
ncbi:MAG: 16S rRNA (guanine(527)-N(7))-methyltransferase RsmG [Acholeplasmatales bacterium]|nr:16S rRNA (guanine(527)-N(7))-methyltransferase RsmG [Acholeplasmatales bacterium]